MQLLESCSWSIVISSLMANAPVISNFVVVFFFFFFNVIE